jgi:hypothetical protein
MVADDTIGAPTAMWACLLLCNRVVKERIMANTRPVTFSRTGMIWLTVFFVVVLIVLAFSLLPIKFAWFS